MKKTQEQWVKNQLRTTGRVSRNGALQNYISRLGAIIHDLNKNGWNIVGDFEKIEHGKDYIYHLVSAPHVAKVQIREVDGVRQAVLL